MFVFYLQSVFSPNGLVSKIQSGSQTRIKLLFCKILIFSSNYFVPRENLSKWMLLLKIKILVPSIWWRHSVTFGHLRASVGNNCIQVWLKILVFNCHTRKLDKKNSASWKRKIMSGSIFYQPRKNKCRPILVQGLRRDVWNNWIIFKLFNNNASLVQLVECQWIWRSQVQILAGEIFFRLNFF